MDGAGHKENNTEIDLLLKRINNKLENIAIRLPDSEQDSMPNKQQLIALRWKVDDLLFEQMPRLRELCQKTSP